MNIDFLINSLSLVLAIASLIIAILVYSKYDRLKKLVLARFIKQDRRRIRKRYVVLRLVSSDVLKKEEVEDALSKVFIRFFGEAGYVKANPKLVFFDEKRGSCIVRINHIYVRALVSILWMIRDINGKECLVIPVKTTGTIRKAHRVMYGLTT